MLTSEVLRQAADLHSQASSIEQTQALSLAQVDRVTSSLPDRMSLLEIKLDDLTKEALVLKNMSLDSGTTLELTSRAVRHLLKGKGLLLSPSSGQKAAALALEGPSSLLEEELSCEEILATTTVKETALTDQRVFIPSALDRGASSYARSGATSPSGSDLSRS